MPGIGVIVNPRARGNRRAAVRGERLQEILGSDGLVRTTTGMAELEEAAREFRAEGIEVLAICGGDGSYFRTLTAFATVYGEEPLPLLLPLRAGTINYIAKSIGGRRGRPEHVLAHVVRDYRRGRTHELTERELLCINGNQYGFVLGCGLVVNYLRAYYARRHQGPVAAAALLFRLGGSALFGTSLIRGVFRSEEADVMCDGERLPFRVYTLILASTVERIALGFRPTYLARRKRGHFHLLAGPVRPLRLVRRLVRLYRGFPLEVPDLYDSLAREVLVRFARPVSYMIDGDILPPAETLRVAAGRRVTLIRS